MRFPRFVPLYVVLMLSALQLLAQSPDGNINGLVSDSASAAVVGAEVVAVDDVTHVQYTTKTNTEGIYVLPNLPPGPYRLQVSKVGFKTIIKPEIVLDIQGALSINFTLPIGAAFEIVTVEGGASLINTTDASVSTVIDHTYVENMPLNGRSFQDLILLTPGTVTQSPQPPANGFTGLGQTGEFSVNGQRTESNYYTVDGVSANVGIAPGQVGVQSAGVSGSVAASTALGTTQALVSVDDLQEFRVQSSSYSAEYGRNPGGQFAFETKSGTNRLHGTAYDYLRNGAVDAQDWFSDYFGVKQPALRQNDFGATLGGPVKIPSLYDGIDKTFFFLSYEGLRLAVPQPATASFVPDTYLRSQAPEPLDQVLNAFPAQSPNGIDDMQSHIAQSIGTWSNPGSLNSTSVRFDHALSDKVRLFFRFSETGSSSAARGSSGNAATMDVTSNYSIRTYTFGATSAVSNRVSNSLRVNRSGNEVTDKPVINGLDGSTPVDLQQLTGLGRGSQPAVDLSLGNYYLQLSQQPQAGKQSQWNLVDTVGFSFGSHQFKFGIDYRRLAPVVTPPNPFVAWFYFSDPSILSNNADLVYASTVATAHPLYQNLSAFAQDDWRVGARLTLSLGLRWDVNPAPGVTQGLMPYTVLVQGIDPTKWALAPQGTPLWQTTWYNFAPRLGIAYVLRVASSTETVVRGGGGIFFDTGQQFGSIGFYGPGFVQYSPFGTGSFPVLPAGGIPVIVNPPVAPYGGIGASVYAFAPHLQLPYTLHWNASIEQALGKAQAVTLSYVGSHGSRLLRQNWVSVPQNPNSQFFYFVANGSASDYNALEAQFRRRLSGGFTALASYTWSHCIDYGSQNYSLGYERGNCDFDVRHNLSAAMSYDLPNLGHSGLMAATVGHWGIDDRVIARTSFPVTLNGNYLVQPNGQYFLGGLNLVQDQPVYLYGTRCASVLQALGDLIPGQTCPGGRAINPQAFANVTSGSGDAPRNFARGFDAVQMNLAIRRDFPIRERLKLQFRAEAFNIFNHPNFGTVNANFGQTTFGQASSTLANSLGVLSPLYQMGGSRSMQFALKVVF